jgi:hypothetical protein
LFEEAGLSLPLRRMDCGARNWPVYAAEASPDERVRLVDSEHDRFEWLPLDAALARCTPDYLSETLRTVAGMLGLDA